MKIRRKSWNCIVKFLVQSQRPRLSEPPQVKIDEVNGMEYNQDYIYDLLKATELKRSKDIIQAIALVFN